MQSFFLSFQQPLKHFGNRTESVSVLGVSLIKVTADRQRVFANITLTHPRCDHLTQVLPAQVFLLTPHKQAVVTRPLVAILTARLLEKTWLLGNDHTARCLETLGDKHPDNAGSLKVSTPWSPYHGQILHCHGSISIANHPWLPESSENHYSHGHIFTIQYTCYFNPFPWSQTHCWIKDKHIVIPRIINLSWYYTLSHQALSYPWSFPWSY